MKQKPAPHRLALGLLLAASAIPFTALSAQDTTAPAAPVHPAAPAPAPQQTQSRTSILPFVLIGALLLGALAFLALRRRRRADVVYDEVYDTPAPVEPIAAAPLAAAPIVAETGRP